RCSARIELRQALRQQTITCEHEWNSRVAEQERVEQRERAHQSAEGDPDRDPLPFGSDRGDLWPAAFGPCCPIGRTERGEQRDEVTESHEWQGEAERARIAA